LEKRPGRRPVSVGGMELTVSRCFVQVHDPDVALAFYRDGLGLEVRDDVANEGFRWITVGAAAQPEIAIVLSDYVNGGPTDRDAVAALLAKGALNGVHFRTDDIDAAFERVRVSGAEIVQEPTDQFWGVRDFAVRDPSGNLVRVDQAPAG
jgi:catechol 2,3-dioxygenase-like lactoylglutathione lyase family enzyme